MSRKKSYVRRQIMSDAKYNCKTVAKFINHIMVDGKKSIAEKLLYTAMDIIKERSGGDLSVLHDAIEKVSPAVEVKSRRIGGSTYQVPSEVSPFRKSLLGMRWIIEAASKRKDVFSMSKKLANEILEAVDGRGGAIKKREEVHKVAEANKSFSHFRF